MLQVDIIAARAQLEQHLRLVEGLHERTVAALVNGMRASVAMLVRQALTGPRQKFDAAPRYLARRTGGTARSVSASPKVRVERFGRSKAITGWIGGDIVVAAHEEGVDKVVDVRPHRRRRRTARGSELGPDALTLSGRIKKRYVGGSGIVQGHKRRMRLRARHMLGDTIDENRRGIQLRMRKAALIAARRNRVPSVQELSTVSIARSLRG